MTRGWGPSSGSWAAIEWVIHSYPSALTSSSVPKATSSFWSFARA